MGATAKPRCAIVFLMILTLGVSLGLPAEDALDAVYDESEPLPYENVPLVPIVLSPVAVRTTQSHLSSLGLNPGAPSPFTLAHVHDTDTHRCDDAGASLAQLCTLLC
jgi:hypothetical protein